MGFDPSSLPQNAWLFTREHESVRLEVRSAAQQPQLVVLGPGPNAATFDFAEAAALEQFRLNYERELLDQGFRLQAVTERRSGPRGAHDGAERRRR